MKTLPRFYCDNCGTEVGRETLACPKCGRDFNSVRCPSCGYAGEASEFVNGCPVCRFSANDRRAAERSVSKKNGNTHGAPPLWLYLTASLLLALAVAALIYMSRVG